MKALGLNLGIKHRGLKVCQAGSNDDPRMTFDLSMTRSNGIPICLYGENVEKSFSETVLKTVRSG